LGGSVAVNQAAASLRKEQLGRQLAIGDNSANPPAGVLSVPI
jgi:hypothetical protein